MGGSRIAAGGGEGGRGTGCDRGITLLSFQHVLVSLLHEIIRSVHAQQWLNFIGYLAQRH